MCRMKTYTNNRGDKGGGLFIYVQHIRSPPSYFCIHSIYHKPFCSNVGQFHGFTVLSLFYNIYLSYHRDIEETILKSENTFVAYFYLTIRTYPQADAPVTKLVIFKIKFRIKTMFCFSMAFSFVKHCCDFVVI